MLLLLQKETHIYVLMNDKKKNNFELSYEYVKKHAFLLRCFVIYCFVIFFFLISFLSLQNSLSLLSSIKRKTNSISLSALT